jgi:YgiT-type zinc finger domain-containing protein
MKCHVCGSRLRNIVTDLPFKIADNAIVILKGLPVLQCESCREFLIEDAIMARVETILDKADASVELEVVRFAA